MRAFVASSLWCNISEVHLGVVACARLPSYGAGQWSAAGMWAGIWVRPGQAPTSGPVLVEWERGLPVGLD